MLDKIFIGSLVAATGAIVSMALTDVVKTRNVCMAETAQKNYYEELARQLKDDEKEEK